jgi:hypothetical protein
VEPAYDDCDDGQRASTAFDFDGDGGSDIVTLDATHLRVIGSDGIERARLCNTTEPGLAFPMVIDADGDGRGEIVAPASSRLGTTCNGAAQAGITVFEVQPSRPTRTIVQQFAYQPRNVDDDGRVRVGGASDPLATTFRSNPAVLSDPDLKIAMLPGCEFAGARVRNVGNAAVRSGAAAVAFFVEGQLAGEIPSASRSTAAPPSTCVSPSPFRR